MKNRLHEYCQNCWDKSNCKNCAIKETKNYIKKLKEENKLFKSKEIPMKPNHVSIIKGLLGKYVCPICGHQIHFKQGDNEPSEIDRYCSKCGQAIDGSKQV